ncbi:30S ribosome-binding factor RbfA [Cellulosilyticum sp. WCF-2]|uniref:30S ribosome-binding factor RbfA n=1 Tax=Cellulosilyticum sp. WCF-2 TaxID=2497860 RepID=UPI000F8E8AF4|nr:30S ribosome-binding factor RbfA [Cellulosilyticum sp. WCF-2]QEH69566.1 30S ribosome-binding factor RbfA [Cellulosilyticum sp. WCF-2]
MASQRLTRINEEMRREIAEIVRSDIKDPGVQDAMISVIAVETTNDLKTAKVFISVLQDNKKEAALAALTKAQGYIRKEIARRINLRNTPELLFRLDESIERGMQMSKMIANVMKDNNK